MAKGDDGSDGRKSRWQTAVQLSLLLIGSALALAPALRAEFIWDDFRQVVQSEQIRELDSIPGYFTHHVWEREEGFEAAEGIRLYRPLFQAALSVEYRLWGGASAWGFHLGSLACHLLAAVLLWALARRWIGAGGWPALAAGLMFALHPVTAEAYAWVSALTDLLAGVGLLAALLLLDRLGSNAAGSGPGSLRVAWAVAILAGGLALAGMLGKEVALLALPVASLWLRVGRGVPLRYHLPLWIGAGIFLAARMAVLGGLEATGRDTHQLLTAIHRGPILLVDGLRALAFMQPVGYRGLAYDYEPLSWVWTAGASAVLLLLAVVAWRTRRSAPMVWVALGVHCLVMAPVAMIATVPGWGGFGRYLYIPAAFVVLALVQTAVVTVRWVAGRTTRRWLGAALVVPALYLTVQQIALRDALRAYSCSEELALSAIANAPEVGVGYELLGHVRMDRGDLPGAIESYEAALERTPELLEATTNLGLALIHTGDPEAGLALMLERETERAPGPRSSYVVALALLHLARVDEASERLLWAIERAPEDEDLLWLQVEVLARHPDPEAYRTWLRQELSRPGHARAAAAIEPLLATVEPRTTGVP